MWLRYGAYAAAYIVALFLLAILLPWKMADLLLFSGVVGASKDPVSDQVVAFDLDARPSEVRKKLTEAITYLANEKPKVVVVDVAFSARPTAPTPTGPDPLRAALEALNKHAKVYGAVIPAYRGGGSAAPTPPPGSIDVDLYAETLAFSGLGHTLLNPVPFIPMSADRVIGYYPTRATVELPAPLGEQELPAIPLLVKHDEDTGTQDPVSRGADDDKAIFWAGARIAREPLKEADVDDKYVVIGNTNTEMTTPGGRYGRPGWELLAWAIGDQLAVRKPLFSSVVMWLITALFSCFAVVLFVTIWRKLKTRPFAFLLSTVTALVVSMALLFGLELVAFSVLNVIFVQLTLVHVGILSGVVVAWIWCVDTLRHERFLLALWSAAKPVEQYDVFISYAHGRENSAWVEDQIVGPLSRAKREDGYPIRVFFDRTSIRIGMDWYQRLVEGVQGSRYFVPIYSKGYFNRFHCRDEFALAMIKRSTHVDFIFPLSRLSRRPPPQYRDIQYVDVQGSPTFVEDLIRVVARVQRNAPAAAGHDMAEAVS